LDPYNGLLRGTIAGMSATLGGADAVMIRPFDELWANSTEALRYARNTQHLLKEESMLDAVQDPMKGALIVEKLCAKLLESGWNTFQKWSNQGTYLELLNQGFIENAAENAASQLQKQLDDQSLILLGVNKYNAPQSTLPELKALEAKAEIKAFRWAEKHESKSEKV
ncbi:MAG: methylmalonyl-CoA mutase family protein, partial [Flavobacteriales bacterium]|nr:methylmalonyl-CoA mutase family protein [Flavobacteriales bacterium]